MQCSEVEFVRIIAFMESATGAPATPKERVEIYYQLLADYPARVIETAVKQVIILHQYPNLPPVGAIRSMILELQQPPIHGHDAWEMFVKAMRKHGYGTRTVHRAGHEPEKIDNERNGLDSLPPRVRQAARAFGWRTLCETAVSDMGIARTQFLKIYESVCETNEQSAIMPPEVKTQAAAIANDFQEKQIQGRGPKELAAWIREQELKKTVLNKNEQLMLDGEVVDLPFAPDLGQGDA